MIQKKPVQPGWQPTLRKNAEQGLIPQAGKKQAGEGADHNKQLRGSDSECQDGTEPSDL